MSVTEKQKSYHLRKMRTRFTRIDVNGDGYVSREEFELMGKNLAEYSGMTKERAEVTCKIFRKVADGLCLKPGVKTTVYEAAQIVSEALIYMTPEQQDVLFYSGHNALFDVIDANENGYISIEEFKLYFKVIGPGVSEAEINHSFNTIDSDENGKISREEFLAAARDFFFGLEETENSNVFFGHLLH